MEWVKSDIDPDDVREIAKKYNINLITASILIRRGIVTEEDIFFFTHRELKYQHNPFLFRDMEEAIDRINVAIEAGEKIFVFGDRDVDGITSTVLIVETIRELGGDVEWMLPEGEDDYGLSFEVIKKVAASGSDLLITVDCGITGVREVELANEVGIDVIIIDHHNVADKVPNALAIINPKLAESGYPFKELSGCGVVSKVVWALYFSRTPFYATSVCLLNATPANDSVIVEVVRLNNLLEVDRLTENFVPGFVDFESTRLSNFIRGYEVVVYDSELQSRLLKRVFGNNYDFDFSDLRDPVRDFLPKFTGKSLLRIKDILNPTGWAKYREIDALKELFIDLVLKREEKIFENYLKRLDLVALGTIADLMPIINENRILVRYGMDRLKRTMRTGLREFLMRKSLVGKDLKTMDVAWQISPFINSAGRMGEPGKATELLLSDDLDEAVELVDYILGLNKKRKNLGSDAWNSLIGKARESYDKTGGKFVLAIDPDVHRGITGIMAARLVGSFGVPSMVITEVGDKAVGSLRSVPAFSIKNFLDNFSDILTNYGGHDFAAGFSLPKERVGEFEERFYNLIDTMDVPEKSIEKINIDAEIPVKYLTPAIEKVIEFFEPYGEKNPPLVFLTRGITIESFDIVGKGNTPHLKLLLRTDKYKWPAIFWKAAEEAVGLKKGMVVDIIYKIVKNFYQNTESLQLNIIKLIRE